MRPPGSVTQFRVYLYVPTVTVPALAVVGTSDSSWGAITLPFDLTPVGAPGNNVYVDWVLAFPGVTSGTGSTNIASIDVNVPNDPALGGAQFYAQGYLFDPPANALGVLATRAMRGTFPSPVGLTRVYRAGDPTATTGVIGMEYGLAFGFN